MQTSTVKYSGLKHFGTRIAAVGALFIVFILLCLVYHKLDD
jgi:hypothetical protein